MSGAVVGRAVRRVVTAVALLGAALTVWLTGVAASASTSAISAPISGSFGGTLNEGGGTLTWTGSAVFDSPGRNPGNTGLSSGHISWQASGIDSGNCVWSGDGSFKLRPGDGEAATPPGGSYYLQVNVTNTYPAWTETCPNNQVIHEQFTFGYIFLQTNPYSSKAHDNRLKGTYTLGFDTWHWDFVAGNGLRAVPGGPYDVMRAGTAHLDGSASTPKRKIRSYRWTFNPGAGCPPGVPRDTHKSGARVSIVALCSLDVALTVSDGKNSDTHTTQIQVTPRRWLTPVTMAGYQYRYYPDVLPPVADPFDLSQNDQPRVEVDGENLSACPHANQDTPPEALVCPLYYLHHTFDNYGYRLVQVHDRGGPFDGWWYVGSSTMSIERKAWVNGYLFSGAPRSPLLEVPNFYTYNSTNGRDVAGFLQALLEHEGWGKPGVPRSGHTSAIKEEVIEDGGRADPRKIAEKMFGPRKRQLVTEIDEKVLSAQAVIKINTDDPLAVIWRGQLYKWYVNLQKYELTVEESVGPKH